MADRLTSYGLEALYASGLKRAQETAQAISETTGLPVRTVEAFHEIEFGELTGLSNEEIESCYGNLSVSVPHRKVIWRIPEEKMDKMSLIASGTILKRYVKHPKRRWRL